jgi:DNA-binding XRE family transcriptional regulator
MGRPEEHLKRDGSPEREFAFWLRDLRNHAGLTYEGMARAVNYSTSTMQSAAAGRQLPTLKVTLAFVRACNGDLAQWENYWTQVKRALDSDSPFDAEPLVRPPWAARRQGTTAPRGASAQVPPADGHARPAHWHPGPNAASGAPALPQRTRAFRGRQAGASAAPGAGAPPSRARAGPCSARLPGSRDGWYVSSFAASLRMDTPEPEVIEDRVVVATVDGIRELATSISAPRHRDDPAPEHKLNAELIYGGSLRLSDQPSESYFRNIIALANPLKAGQHHRYRLCLRVPPGQRMAPHYVYLPLQRTDHFELRVRFDPAHLPERIWALSGTPPVVIYEDPPDGAVLTPDRFGEIRVAFHGLRIGLGYGLRWEDELTPRRRARAAVATHTRAPRPGTAAT